MRVRSSYLLISLVGLIAVLVLVAPVAIAQVDTTPTETCPALVSLALAQVSNNCANLGGNSVCYGYGDVDATSKDGTRLFSQPSDRTTLNSIAALRTSPLNLDANSWGVALMNVRVATESGSIEEMVMVLLGDVEVENAVTDENLILVSDEMPTALTESASMLYLMPSANASALASVPSGASVGIMGVSPDGAWLRVSTETSSGWISRAALAADLDVSALPEVQTDSRFPMQSFNFSTGGGDRACADAPPSLLILQAPNGVTATVEANGAQITFNNTIFLRTDSNETMELIGVTGDATVNAGGSSALTVRAGVSITAPLNAQGRVSGEWSNWHILSRRELESYAAVEYLPENVLNAPLAIPVVLQVSPSTDVPPIVVNTPTPPFVLTPPPPDRPPFPEPPLTVGVPGQPLPGSFVPFTIGGPVCPAWIAYHSDRTGDWDVYRLGPTLRGNDVSDNLSQGRAAADIQPSRSQDAEWVAFTTNRDGLTNWEIYAGRSNGSERRRLTFNTAVDINPVWGQEAAANKLVFESNRDANWELYMLDVSTGELERLTDDPSNDVDAVWRADGNALVFSSDRDGDYELFMLDMITREVTQLTDNTTDDISPAYSSNLETDLVAWMQLNTFGVYDLYIMNMTTGEQELLIDLGSDINLPTFAPSDDFIAFESNVDGDFDVFAIDLTTRVVKDATDNVFNDRAPSFRCESDIIIYQSDSPGNWDIFQVNPLPIIADSPGNQPTRLTQTETTELYAVNQPLDEDGSREGRLP